MKLLRNTIFILIAFSFLPTGIKAFSATKYNLDVSINISTSEITGIARIDADAGKELLLVRNETLAINYIKLYDKPIAFNEDDRTLRIVPDRNGTLEISYRAYFRDNQ
jgi:hypothetical protein